MENNKHDDGGPAYAYIHQDNCGNPAKWDPGKSLLDEFAGQAMQGIIYAVTEAFQDALQNAIQTGSLDSFIETSKKIEESIPKSAYDIAANMIAEKRKREDE